MNAAPAIEPGLPPALAAPASGAIRRQLVALALALVVLSGLLVALALAQQHQQDLESGQRLNESLAQVVEAQAVSAVQAVDQRLQLTAQGLALLEAVGQATPERVRALLREQAAALPFVRSIWVLDVQGRVVHAPEPSAVGLRLSDRDYFQIYQRQPQTDFYLGNPIRSRTSGLWLISAARPLRSASGAFAGLVVAGLDPPYFDRLWHTLHLGPDGVVALLRRDGVMMMRSPFNEAAMGRRLLLPGLQDPAVKAPDNGHYSGPSPVDGRLRLTAYRTLAGRPELLVLVARSADTVLAAWRQQAWLALSIWAAAAAVVGLLFAALNRAWRQRLQADEHARQMAERLTLATNAAAIGVWDWDVQHDVWHASDTYYAMLGWAADVGSGDRQRGLDAVHPDDRAGVLARIQAVLDGADAPYTYEARMRHADGSLRWVQVAGRVLARDAAGKPTRLLGVRTDITERQQLMQRLQTSEARFRASFNSAGIGMAIKAPDGHWLEVNQRFCDIVGYPAQVLLQTNFQHITHPDDLAVDLAHTQALLEGKADFFQMEKRYLHAQGLPAWVHLTLSIVRDGAGRPQYFVAHVEDINQRKALEQALGQNEAALRRALAEQGALLKEVHHRVKNNLQIIHSLLRLEAGRSLLPETATVLRDMRGRIQSMALLHESLYRSGSFASVDLGAYLRQVATQAFRALSTPHGAVQLQLELASTRLELEQALPCGLLVNELISNSLKHGFPNGRSGELRVTLRVLDGADALQLCVSDTGVGLPSDFATRQGQSLGLQLVADLADQLQGQLTIGPPPLAVFCLSFKPGRPPPNDEGGPAIPLSCP